MADENLNVIGINHVVLHVTDMSRSLVFYVDKLGFDVVRKIEDPARRRSFLRRGENGLDLFEAQDADGGEEMNHLAVSVANNLEQVIQGCATLGIETSEPTKGGSVFITDPDGHRLEMIPVLT